MYQAPVAGLPGTKLTTTVYGLIKASQHHDAIVVLEQQLQALPSSRAILSLLAYCYYANNNFEAAATTYGQLSRLHPQAEEYRTFYAQSLYKAGSLVEARKAATQLQCDQQRRAQLHLAIEFDSDNVAGCRQLLEQLPAGSPTATASAACWAYKEGAWEEARAGFTAALAAGGHRADFAYAAAVCSYRCRQLGPALQGVADIIERGVHEHPELAVGSAAEAGEEVHSVGNSAVLRETALVEAFNLKAAVEYQLGNSSGAQEAMRDMPPRSEAEIDPVTLHNSALVHMHADAAGGFRKLNHLLAAPPFPPETLANLLLLYCSPTHGFTDLAADVMAENPALVVKHLDPELRELLEALALRTSGAPDEANRRLDSLADRHVGVLRAATKRVQDARLAHDTEALKQAVLACEGFVEAYIPVLTAQASVAWEAGRFSRVLAFLQSSEEFCSTHPVWRLNLAHTFFMQGQDKEGDIAYQRAIQHYEPIIAQNEGQLLQVTAVVLANLCVAYIMTHANDAAENLMKRIEKEEEEQTLQDPHRPTYHLCIVNLVIGTLYCSKGNYEFGISRVIKALEPCDKKLGTDTWFYAKRCLAALADQLSKHMIQLKDDALGDIMLFLDACEAHGAQLPAAVDRNSDELTVAVEARQLKRIFFLLYRQ